MGVQVAVLLICTISLPIEGMTMATTKLRCTQNAEHGAGVTYIYITTRPPGE